MALLLSRSLHPTEWTHAALAALREHRERLMIDMDRRTFMEGAGVGIAYAATASAVPALAESAPHEAPTTTVRLTVNGKVHTLTVEDRTTLLDALRNQIGLPGPRKVAIAENVAPAQCISMAIARSPA
jgi:hypothetical protein